MRLTTLCCFLLAACDSSTGDPSGPGPTTTVDPTPFDGFVLMLATGGPGGEGRSLHLADPTSDEPSPIGYSQWLVGPR